MAKGVPNGAESVTSPHVRGTLQAISNFFHNNYRDLAPDHFMAGAIAGYATTVHRSDFRQQDLETIAQLIIENSLLRADLADEARSRRQAQAQLRAATAKKGAA